MKNLFSNVRGDAFGGITAGIVALPLALAFGVSSGLGASAGLYGAIFIAFFAALFGGTDTQISGPTAPMTAVSMVVIAGLIAQFDGEVEKALPTILLVFLLAGLIQILLGFAKLGSYIKYIPYPVVSGFMTAIGVIILLTQILPFLGYYPKEDMAFVNQMKPEAEAVIFDKILKEEAGEDILVLDDYSSVTPKAQQVTQEEILSEAKTLVGNSSSGVIGSLKTIPRALKHISWTSVILALATIFIIYGFKRITKAIPSTLVALLVVSGFAFLFLKEQGLFGEKGYRTISEIPRGFPKFWGIELFSGLKISTLVPFLGSAVMLSLLGAIDSLLTSVVADNMTKTRHNSNRELIGQGIGNGIGSMFGGIPGAGATIRTVVNINSGGRTRLSGMIAGVLLLIVLLLLGPVASKIPAAVLAGILITVGIGVMDYKGLKAVSKMPKSEVIIMAIVLLLSVFWNLIYAVGIGLVLASLVFMKKMADISVKKSRVSPIADEESWEDEKELPEKFKEEVFIKHIEGPLFFGSTQEIQQLSEKMPDTVSHLVFRMDKVPYIDQSGLYTIEDLILSLTLKGVTPLMVGLQQQPKILMEKVNIIPSLIKEDQLFDNFHDCSEWVKSKVENTHYTA